MILVAILIIKGEIMAPNAEVTNILPHLPLKKVGKGYMHTEHNSLKFYMYANKWHYKWFSRGESGDLIDYLRKHENKSFNEAKAYVSETKILTKKLPETPEWQTKTWQKKANRLIYYATEILLKTKSKPLQFLKDRGLKLSTIIKWKIGFSPEQTIDGNHYPAKHIIPIYNSDRKLIRVRFRYWDNPKMRYSCMKGSDGVKPYPIGIDLDKSGQTIVVCESELDGLLIHQESGYKVGVLALGHAKAPDKSVYQWLQNKSARVILSLDNDSAGKKATAQWQEVLPQSHVLDYPGKDPGESLLKLTHCFRIRSYIPI
jgi:DNA primase